MRKGGTTAAGSFPNAENEMNEEMKRLGGVEGFQKHNHLIPHPISIKKIHTSFMRVLIIIFAGLYQSF